MQTVDGYEEFDSLFSGLGRQLQDMDFTEALQESANEFRSIHAGYFAREAGPSGTSWPEWMWKRRGAAWDHKTLDDTGRLKESLTGTGPDHIEEITPHSLEWGTSVPYSRNHQFGGTFVTTELLITRYGGRKPEGSFITIPPREHVGLRDSDVDAVVNRIADAVLEQFMPAAK